MASDLGDSRPSLQNYRRSGLGKNIWKRSDYDCLQGDARIKMREEKGKGLLGVRKRTFQKSDFQC